MCSSCDIILGIENSNPSLGGGGVSLVRVTRADAATVDSLRFETLASQPILPVERNHDDLMPAIERVVRAADLRPADLTRVAVSIGPGGYTAVRSACSAGKLIALGLGTPCVAVPTALVAATEVVDSGQIEPFVVLLAGKDETSHATKFAGFALKRANFPWKALPDSIQEVGLIGPSQIELLGVRLILGDRHVPRSIREEADRLGIPITQPPLSATACARLGGILKACTPEELNPIYPREPDAVTLWRSRKG